MDEFGKDIADQSGEMVSDTVIDPGADKFRVANVASRMGKCDASGDTYAEFTPDISRCQFSRPQFTFQHPSGEEAWWQK